MLALRIAHRSAVVGIVLLFAACATLFVPQSRSRGHIFDESSRGNPQVDSEDGVRRLSFQINNRFPLGSPLIDLLRHVEGAGGSCFDEPRGVVGIAPRSTTCTYENTNYFAHAYMGLGEPTLQFSRNSWTVVISHTDGAIDGYQLDGFSAISYISPEDYAEGLERQRAEEELQQTNGRN